MENSDLQKSIDALKKSKRKSDLIYAFIPLVIIFIVLLVFWDRLEDKDDALNEKEIELKLKEDTLKIRENNVDTLERQLAKARAQFAKAMEDAQKTLEKIECNKIELDTTTYFYQQIQQKNNTQIALEEIKGNRAFNKSAIIFYHRQGSDGENVINTFAQLGLKENNYEVKPSTIVNNIGPINSISYGSKVDISSLKILILELINSGFEIHAIKKYGNDSGRENTITIYRSSYALNNPIWTAEEVMKKINK
jgi:hypothetical protein